MLLMTNFALVLAAALLLSLLMEKLRLPGLLGMVLTGVLLGPRALGFMDSRILQYSLELRDIALIIILIRAGLGISRTTMNKVGIPAVKLSFIPGVIEGLAIMLGSHYLFQLPWRSAGMLGFIIAAVSPAVVVPQMLDIKDKGLGSRREVPTLILAGASADDVFAITIFGAFLAAETGQGASAAGLLATIPLSILTGLAGGLLLGWVLSWVFKKVQLRATRKALVFLFASILFFELGEHLPVASLIGIMAMGFMVLERDEALAHSLAGKFNKLWVLAELVLFVLIGAQVDVSAMWTAGPLGLVLIGLGLLARSAGVWLSLLGSSLDRRERLFCMIAYTPKATVQAAIGAIPLSQGVAGGELILALAVLAIVVTAPLGSVAIAWSAPRLLSQN